MVNKCGIKGRAYHQKFNLCEDQTKGGKQVLISVKIKLKVVNKCSLKGRAC